MTAGAPFASALIDRMTLEALDREEFPDPRDQAAFLKNMNFLRLTRLERPQPEEPAFEARANDLLVALQGCGARFAFAIVSADEIVTVWIGASVSPPVLRALADGIFPGLPAALQAEPPPLAHFKNLPYALAVSGAPCVAAVPAHDVAAGRPNPPSPFDALIRGIGAARWAYLVSATPAAASDTKNALDLVSKDIAELRRRYLATSDPARPDRTVTRALELLEAQHRRLENALATGRWLAEVHFFAETEEVLGLGHGFLRAALAPSSSQPAPLRVHKVAKTQARPRARPEAEPLTTQELARFAHPPAESAVGYELIAPHSFGLAAPALRPGAPTIRLGRILCRGRPTSASFEMTVDDLRKHTLIVGVTGSGKTNTCMKLLEQAQRQGVPFLVIESAKTEYRRLATRPEFGDLSVFTVGLERVSPLRLNPFEVPPGVPIQSHIDYLKSLFAAAFVLYPPMPYVLEASLHEAYEDRGWNLRTDENFRVASDEPRNGRDFPTMRDVVRKVEEVVDRLRYSGEVLMDVKAGLVARLNSLASGGGKGPMFDTRVSTSPDMLFGKPCILELHHIVSDEEKAFLIGLVLIRLYEIRQAAAARGDPPSPHLTLIEEAHRLLRNVSTDQGSEVAANPQGKAIEVFANVLAEVRAYGEGIVIAEQVPAKLIPDAIKNTNLKIVHRLVAEDDRLTLASAMGLGADEARALTTLDTGEALVFAEGMQRPVAARIDPVSGKDDAIDGAKLEAALVARRCVDPETARNLPRPIRNPVFARRLNSAMRVLLLAMLRPAPDFDIVHASFLRVQSLMRSILGDPPDAVVGRAAELIDAEIERRGEFWGWSHGLAAEIFALCLDVVRGLAEIAGERSDPEITTQLGEDLSLCSRGAAVLLDREDAPFAGCAACPCPCWFRYDAEMIVSARMAEDPAATIDAMLAELEASDEEFGPRCDDETATDGTEDRAGLLDGLRYAAAQIYHPDDADMLDGLAFCCAVHILADESAGLTDGAAEALAYDLSRRIFEEAQGVNIEEPGDADR